MFYDENRKSDGSKGETPDGIHETRVPFRITNTWGALKLRERITSLGDRNKRDNYDQFRARLINVKGLL